MFEFILLIVIFTVWLIGARILPVYAVTQHPCVEAVAAFGASENLPPIFELLFWISVLMGVFWAVVTLSFRRVLRTSKSVLFHTSLLLGILVLAANFRMMRLENNIPPDGVLAVRPMIVDMSSTPPTYYPVIGDGEVYMGWYLGTRHPGKNIELIEAQKSCVWLERNLITDNETIRIDGYGVARPAENSDMQTYAQRARGQHFDPVGPKSFSDILRDGWEWSIGDRNDLETLRAAQKYRALTPLEKQRFLEKQTCLNTALFTGKPMSACQWHIGYDLDKMYADNSD